MTTLAADIREMLSEQRQYRDILYQMTRRDLLLRYKQTVMGVGWAIFMPLVNTVIFSVIFTRVAPIDVQVPYPLFAFCGLTAWNFFASALRSSMTSLTSNASLVTKIYFPREMLPFSSIVVAFVDFLIGFAVIVGMMAWYRVPVGPAVLWLPVVVAVQIVFTAGVGLVLAMANLFYRDVKYLSEVLLTAWMFASSVLYPIELLGGRMGRAFRLNPMTTIIDSYRAVLFRGEAPPAQLVAAAVLGLCTLMVAWIVFHRAEQVFAERI